MSDSRRPRVLYLPGLDGTGRLLYRQPALHTAYQVVCASYPQDRLANYEELAAGAARQLEEAGGRGVVLAESFGGAVALTLALARPDLVERLLLVNTFAHFPRRLLIRLGAWCAWFLPARPSHPATRGFRARYFFSPDIPAEVRQQWWERTGDVPMRAMGCRIQLLASVDLRPRLQEVTARALVLVAPDDRVVPPEAGRELARLLPSARLLEMRVGHAALVHPAVDVLRLLAEPAYWERPSAAATAAGAAGSRPG